MRQIVLDTETTGLEYRQGHRLIEIAGVEMENRRLTGRHFHKYINPERSIDAGAQAVHGISAEFLADKPRFHEIVEEFEEFVRDAELIIHNAAFDVGFINHELGLIKRPALDKVCAGVVDTLRMAREMFPGKRNSLDALCERLAVDNSHRTLHGALLDAELLADVYLGLTRGQDSLMIDQSQQAQQEESGPTPEEARAGSARGPRPPLRVILASPEELDAHATTLAAVDKDSKGQCLWLAASKPVSDAA